MTNTYGSDRSSSNRSMNRDWQRPTRWSDMTNISMSGIADTMREKPEAFLLLAAGAALLMRGRGFGFTAEARPSSGTSSTYQGMPHGTGSERGMGAQQTGGGTGSMRDMQEREAQSLCAHKDFKGAQRVIKQRPAAFARARGLRLVARTSNKGGGTRREVKQARRQSMTAQLERELAAASQKVEQLESSGGAGYQAALKRYAELEAQMQKAKKRNPRSRRNVLALPFDELFTLQSAAGVAERAGKKKPRNARGETPKRRRQNPSDGGSAEAYASFHGRGPNRIGTYDVPNGMPANLAQLGQLLKIKVGGSGRMVTTMQWAPEDGVQLASDPKTQTLYIVGGNQRFSPDMLAHMEKQWGPAVLKNHFVLGTIRELTYRTKKEFDRFETIDYYHELGEDTGHRPLLVYDRRNGRLLIVGGAYEVKPEGIVN